MQTAPPSIKYEQYQEIKQARLQNKEPKNMTRFHQKILAATKNQDGTI
jgi:hypothetical protein